MANEPDAAAEVVELAALGARLFDAGQVDEALTLFAQLHARDPRNFEVNKHLGVICASNGHMQGAIPFLRAAVARRDDDPLVFNVLSVCLFELGETEAALAAADRALALLPDFAAAHNSRGNALNRLGRSEPALQAFLVALALEPDDAVLHINASNALRDLDRAEEALAHLDRAIALDPAIPQAHGNRANVLQDLGRHEEALEGYAAALACDSGSVDAHWNRSLCNLMLGRYADAWPEYEWRWRRDAPEGRPRTDLAAPLWLGEEDLRGRTILLHCEQGLGDCLQFVRYAAKVAERGARVVLEAYAPLVALFSLAPGVAEVVPRGPPPPQTDFQCPLMSLPLALRDFGKPPFRDVAYLAAPADRLALWRARLGPAGRPRVGLVCSGNPKRRADAVRSLPLASLLEALPEGPEYHLLQKEVAPRDVDALAAAPGLAFWGDELRDFADTAALCALMDVVVSVDTSVAHVAAATGRPLRVLMHYDSDWRWGRTGEACDWYASARVLRQQARGDWSAPFAQVAAELASLRQGAT